MILDEPKPPRRRPSAGVNQIRARDHNERLLLTLIQRNEALPGSELARQTGLSPQTVSVILRHLERDGLLERGEPTRGKVGKPSVPMRLAPDGILSVGLKIGRRSSDLVLMDSHGRLKVEQSISYPYPLPEPVFEFLASGLDRIFAEIGPELGRKTAGIGVALPFAMWQWHRTLGAPKAEMDAWRDIDLAGRIAAFSDLPVMIENDATAACRAEHVFGLGAEVPDFAYFFLGSFIGGGLVLNRGVWEGRTGNAGAFGSLPVGDGGRQLIDHASLCLLESRLAEAGHPVDLAAAATADWAEFGDAVDTWLAHTARHLARATVTLAAVIDFETVVIDGSFPPGIRRRLVAETRDRLAEEDSRGVTLPTLREGSIGVKARAIGAAALPIISQYFLDTHSAPL